MIIPVKKLKSGFALPEYGLGTWQMGGRREADSSKDEQDVTAIQAALEHGVTHIDTAEMYGAGHCEELVGEAIRGYARQKLQITTKVLPANQSYDGTLRACEASLKRLGCDYVDLYLLHMYPEPGMPISQTMRAMDRLVAEGMVKNIGVCNMTVARFSKAQSHTSNKLVCNQLHYSLQCREPEVRGIKTYCQQHDVLLVAWGPLQKGLLESASVLLEMSKKYNKTAYQVALNWLLTQPNVVTIPKTTQSAHLEENLGAIGWELDQDDAEKLSREFPGQLTVSDRLPLDYVASDDA